MQTDWILQSSILQSVCKGDSQLPVTAAMWWQGCLLKQQGGLQLKLGQNFLKSTIFCELLATLRNLNTPAADMALHWHGAQTENIFKLVILRDFEIIANLRFKLYVVTPAYVRVSVCLVSAVSTVSAEAQSSSALWTRHISSARGGQHPVQSSCTDSYLCL